MSSTYAKYIQHNVIVGKSLFSNGEGSLQYNILAADSFPNIYARVIQGNIIVGQQGFGWNTNGYTYNYTNGQFCDNIFLGAALYNENSTIYLTSTTSVVNHVTSIGPGHDIYYAGNAITAIGQYGSIHGENGDCLAVGVGTSSSAKANCFVAGNNSTDGDYIKVGDTKLTETQLQALLATL